jgi:hypothetical protein
MEEFRTARDGVLDLTPVFQDGVEGLVFEALPGSDPEVRLPVTDVEDVPILLELVAGAVKP